MDTFINSLAEVYFNDQRIHYGTDSVFLRLEADPATLAANSSSGFTGFIVYRRASQVRRSARLYVKCFVAKGKVCGHPVVSGFAVEAHFFGQVEPALGTLRSLKLLVPEFCAAQQRATSISDAGALILKFADGFGRVVGGHHLKYAHLALMAHKIGELHAYTWAARAQKVDTVAPLTGPPYGRHVEELLPTLRRCLRPLQVDRRYAAEVPRLQEVLDNFGAYLNRVVAHDVLNPCCVLCHRDYDQTNVLFRCENGQPQDLRIVDWRSVGYASLGVDLVGVLFVEADKDTRNRCWSQLLDDYHDGLSNTFADVQVPSKERILWEVRVSVPVALYMLANRVDQVGGRRGEAVSAGGWSSCWNDDLVTEVYKELIDRNFI